MVVTGRGGAPLTFLLGIRGHGPGFRQARPSRFLAKTAPQETLKNLRFKLANLTYSILEGRAFRPPPTRPNRAKQGD